MRLRALVSCLREFAGGDQRDVEGGRCTFLALDFQVARGRGKVDRYGSAGELCPPTGVGTNLSKPTEIYMRTISGHMITFKVDSPDKREQRTVTFMGKIDGDKIYFQRSPKVFREGDPGLNGIYGIDGARQFTATRVVSKSRR
jgi:hypothetical protein